MYKPLVLNFLIQFSLCINYYFSRSWDEMTLWERERREVVAIWDNSEYSNNIWETYNLEDIERGMQPEKSVRHINVRKTLASSQVRRHPYWPPLTFDHVSILIKITDISNGTCDYAQGNSWTWGNGNTKYIDTKARYINMLNMHMIDTFLINWTLEKRWMVG